MPEYLVTICAFAALDTANATAASKANCRIVLPSLMFIYYSESLARPLRLSNSRATRVLVSTQGRMSALGQKQTFAPQKVMSALPPKANMCSATRHGR